MAQPSIIPNPRLRVTEIEICAWIAQAEPGAVLEYHRGYLALDRTAFGRFGDAPARAALAQLGIRAVNRHGILPPDRRRTLTP
ncbi:MAG TPA: hypothetical protein PK452_01885, partial [Amaricoccus sp.]|nr:hypothetical protein [Amaricoccus sp.]